MKEFMSDMRMNFIYFPFTTTALVVLMLGAFIMGVYSGT